MPEPIAEGWITTDAAEALTGYSAAYLRRLASQGRITAQKVGRDWLLHRENLLAYHEQMEALGNQRHNPWRPDLTAQGLGRQSDSPEEEKTCNT
jgi:excisionase family DNA binding protein